MSRPVMVDSSWYIARARLGKDPLLDLALVAEDRDIAVCGMIVVEVGRGIRTPRFRQRYEEAWANMLYVAACQDRWHETLQLAWHLDRSGIVLPLQDLHIAACALHIGAVILTTDQHFQQIPGVVSVPEIF